jgi:hypothetical protein
MHFSIKMGYTYRSRFIRIARATKRDELERRATDTTNSSHFDTEEITKFNLRNIVNDILYLLSAKQ